MVGIVPIALGQGAGGDSRAPLGIAVLGGMLFSTILTFYVVPATYYVIERARDASGARARSHREPIPRRDRGSERVRAQRGGA
jgi:hypothetical protein